MAGQLSRLLGAQHVRRGQTADRVDALPIRILCVLNRTSEACMLFFSITPLRLLFCLLPVGPADYNIYPAQLFFFFHIFLNGTDMFHLSQALRGSLRCKSV